MSISAIFKKKIKTDSEGYLSICIIENGETKFKNVGEKIHQKYWNPNKKEVRSNHPQYTRLNNLLKNKIKEFELEYSSTKINKNENKSFLNLLDQEIKRYNFTNNINTGKPYNTTKNHLTTFIRSKGLNDLTFQSIDLKFLMDFSDYLSNKNIGLNSRTKYFKCFRRIYNLGIDQELFEVKKNPFKKFKLRKEKVKKDYLKLEHIQELISSNMERGSTDELNKHRFLVQYFGCGLRVSDFISLRYDNLIFDKNQVNLSFKQYKSTSPHKVQISYLMMKYMFFFIDRDIYYDMYYTRKYSINRSGVNSEMTLNGFENLYSIFSDEEKDAEYEENSKKEILDIYELLYVEQKEILYEKSKLIPNNFLFGMLDSDFFQNIEFNGKTRLSGKFHSKADSVKTMYNRDLKKLDKFIKSGINISSHTARRSFAQNMLSIGTGIYLIMELLGHQDIKTTESYLKGFDTQIITEKINESNNYIMFKRLESRFH